jgi:signal transduction histidine kinase
LLNQLADQERLTISEWSLRRSLRVLCASANDEASLRDVTERLDALELSDPTRFSVAQWWDISRGHHARDGADFDLELDRHIAAEFPLVRWSHAVMRVPTTRPAFPVALDLLVVLMVWLFLTPVTSSVAAVPIAVIAALGVHVWFSRLRWRRSVPIPISWIVTALWSGAAAIGWLTVSGQGGDVGSVARMAVLTAAAVVWAILLVSLVTAVVTAREDQLRDVEQQIARRQSESTAIVSSMASVAAGLASVPPLSDSAAVAACATGLGRLRQGVDAQHARRILDWTESIVSSPGAITPITLQARIEEVVHPWRALVDITVDCSLPDAAPRKSDDVVAIVDEAVRNACRHGEAEHVEISVGTGSDDHIEIVVIDDGVGLDEGGPGVGFERYATVGTGGYEVRDRSPLPGTCVRVRVL